MKHFFEDKYNIVFVVFLLFFLFIELLNISLPAIDQEQVGMQIHSLHFLYSGTPIPLMAGPYHATLEAFIAVPFFSLFGYNVFALRIVPILFGLFSLFFTYFFIKNFLNKHIALLTIFLLLINTTYLIGVKTGTWHSSIMHFFSMGTLFFLYEWKRKKNNVYLYSGLFLLALGLNTRIWFFWFITAMFILAVLFYRKYISDLLKNRFITIILGVLSFTTGLSLYLIQNIKEPFVTIRFIIRYFSGGSTVNVDNTVYFTNLGHVIKNFIYIVGHKMFSGNIVRFQYCKDSIYPYVFFASLIFLIMHVLFFKKRNDINKDKLLFFVGLFILMFLQSPFSLSAPAINHYFLFFPLIQIIIATSIYLIINSLKKTMFLFIPFLIFLLFFLKAEIYLTFTEQISIHYGFLKRYYAPEIYDLADYINQNKELKFFPCAWNIGNSLELLTGDARKWVSVPLVNYPKYSGNMLEEMKYEFIEKLEVSFNDSNNRYIFLPDRTQSYKFREIFFNTVKTSGKRVQLEKTFYDFHLPGKALNMPWITVYSVID